MDPFQKMAICTYYLAKFNKTAYSSLGYRTQQTTHRYIGNVFGFKELTVRNERDRFDYFFPHRAGWEPYRRNYNIHWQYDSFEEAELRAIALILLDGKDVCEVELIERVGNISKFVQLPEYDIEVKEGESVLAYSSRYERNKRLRILAIYHHGLDCQVCGFNFHQTYGDAGNGFIEVHHIKPLSEAGNAHYVNPATDMAVLCSNCHAMAHNAVGKTLSIAELKAIIEGQRER